MCRSTRGGREKQKMKTKMKIYVNGELFLIMKCTYMLVIPCDRAFFLRVLCQCAMQHCVPPDASRKSKTISFWKKFYQHAVRGDKMHFFYIYIYACRCVFTRMIPEIETTRDGVLGRIAVGHSHSHFPH